MPVRQFLSTISPVIAREPAVFVEAMANTCNVEEASGAMGSGRPIVLLKPKVAISTPKHEISLCLLQMHCQTRRHGHRKTRFLSQTSILVKQLFYTEFATKSQKRAARLTNSSNRQSPVCAGQHLLCSLYRQVCLCLPATWKQTC